MDLSKPLAYRMMPKTLDDYVGQEHILGENKILYRTIKADRLSSIILWGPPGCGKTSLAKVISNTTKYKFIKLNAVTAGVSDIKNAIIESENLLMNPSGKCILFIDEIHRFNKLQQDALLPYVENGTVILIGATTENPYFEVNKALISRSMVFQLHPLTDDNIFTVLKRSLEREDGLKEYNVKVEDDILRKFSYIITSNIRDDDVLSRYGGEEFLVILPNTNRIAAYRIADRIRKEISKKLFIDNTDKTVSVSGGIASSKNINCIEELISVADKNLYEAKSKGKNKII